MFTVKLIGSFYLPSISYLYRLFSSIILKQRLILLMTTQCILVYYGIIYCIKMLLYGDLYHNTEMHLRIANNGYSSQKLLSRKIQVIQSHLKNIK